jgi:hypothetical protein
MIPLIQKLAASEAPGSFKKKKNRPKALHLEVLIQSSACGKHPWNAI